MSEREGRKFFFLLQAFLAGLFLIVGVAVAIEAASGGYGIGLVIVYGDGQWARLSVLYFGGAVRCDSDAFAAVKPVTRDTV
jgi:hypothetical protein